MACSASTLWPLRHDTSAHLALPFRPAGPDTLSRALDASGLRRAALRALVILQACRFHARTRTHGPARGVGHRAEHCVPLRCGRYIPGLVLRDAERAPRTVGEARGGPCVAARGSRVAAGALDRWRLYGLIVVRRGKAQAG